MSRVTGPAIALVRLGIGLGLLRLTGARVMSDGVSPAEAAVFARVNGLPDRLLVPAWSVMQVGTLASPLAVGAVARATGHRDLGRRLAVSGGGAWVAAKVVKRWYRRPRPGALLPRTRVRGPEATGMGYVSGHAAVVVAMASAAARSRERGVVGPLVGAVPVVGLARMYVGAHLPLDVVGGYAVGLAVDGAAALLETLTCDRKVT